MNYEAMIDFVIRKPIQKAEFKDIFSKIMLQLHMNLGQVSHSMNEIFFTQ